MSIVLGFIEIDVEQIFAVVLHLILGVAWNHNQPSTTQVLLGDYLDIVEAVCCTKQLKVGELNILVLAQITKYSIDSPSPWLRFSFQTKFPAQLSCKAMHFRQRSSFRSGIFPLKLRYYYDPSLQKIVFNPIREYCRYTVEVAFRTDYSVRTVLVFIYSLGAAFNKLNGW